MAGRILSAEEIEDLVEKAQQGDTYAFGVLYDFFVDPIYRYVYFKVKKDDALDLTENIFLKVWEHLKSYRRSDGRATFSSWVYRIAHNVVVDHYRMEKEYAALDANAADDKRSNDPVKITEQKLGGEVLKKAMSKLKKTYRQIILLKYINELENHEIARIIGKSEGSVRILKFRALKALKEILENMKITY
jgi:RNA polymerase sigma-70 factor, ECF subfamily